MAEVIFSNIFFLAFSPIPGGASIRQTGTFHPFFRSSAPTFSRLRSSARESVTAPGQKRYAVSSRPSVTEPANLVAPAANSDRSGRKKIWEQRRAPCREQDRRYRRKGGGR